MSQLLAPTPTTVDSIPLGRRLKEIMKAKGSRYSVTAMAGRIGLSRETLRLMLSDSREIYWFELEKIAADLKLPVARILQEDIQELDQEVQAAKKANENLERATESAKARYAKAIGITEETYALIYVGGLYLIQERLQEAQEYFLKAQQLAEQISAQYGEQELLSRVLINLSIIYTARQDYDKALEIISSSEEIVKSAPSQATVLYFTLAESMAAANRMQEAVQYGRKSLDAMLETDNQQMIGRAYANLGWYEYCNFNYEAARTLLEQSLESTTGEYDIIYVLKRLAKVLIGQKANREAEAVIRKALGMEAIVKYPEKEGRLLILLSKASRVPHYAEKVAYNLKYSMNVRFLAYRFLTHYYKRRLRSGKLARAGAQRSFSKRRFLIDKNI